jgi:tetratricopeptide (TPR) repeat protein
VYVLSVLFLAAAWAQGQVTPAPFTPHNRSDIPKNKQAEARTVTPAIPPSRLGDLHMVRKRFRAAIDSYHEALEAVPRAMHKAAIGHHELKEYTQAESLYIDALSLDPENPELMNNIGALHFDRGEYAKACEFYEKAIALDAARPALHYNYAAALFHHRKYAQSADAFRTAVKLDPAYLDQSGAGDWRLQDRRVSIDPEKLYFALYQAYEGAGLSERAGSYLDRARQSGFEEEELKDQGGGFFGWLADLFR